jgi:DNA-binding CsgD family transcriptional regulator
MGLTRQHIAMSRIDAAAVVLTSAAVLVLLVHAQPEDGLLYLLAVPIWIVARDLGVVAGLACATGALLFALLVGAQGVDSGTLGYLGPAALFCGTVAAGHASRAVGHAPIGALTPLLTARPEIGEGIADLSRRELQVLEMIATGANNAEIAERCVISLNTVKSHVSHILRKLKAANRTEAASAYVELYGPPGADEQSSLQGSLQ